jgi:hypothetical protein
MRESAIVEVDGPCWVLRLANGKTEIGDWPDSHYASDTEAAKAAADMVGEDEPVRHVPVRLPARCWEATAACGYQYDEDDEGVEHAEDPGELMSALVSQGWKPIDGGGMTCGDDRCTTCTVLPVVQAPVEIPGQTALPVERTRA